MNIKKFTEEEIEILKSNKYTYRVTKNTIRFTKEFKEIFYKKLLKGNISEEIVESLGYDLKILGDKRPRGIALHIKEEYETYNGFHDGKLNSKNIEGNDLTEKAEIMKLQAKVRYLEQQVEFLKKILKEDT